MKTGRIVLGVVLVCSLLVSSGALIYVFFRGGCIPGWQGVAAELLLVVVIAAEGLFAVFHLHEARAERQAESLRDFMHDFASKDALAEREELYTNLPWDHDFGRISPQPLQSTRAEGGTDVTYKMKGNATCVIPVTMKSDVWPAIQRMCDHYHFAGISCERGWMAERDVLQWMGPRPLRW